MDKTDLTNVLVSVFKTSSAGMGHFGKMHFSFPGIISFEIMVACP